MKTLAIFGSTGSVGVSALKVLNYNKNKFKLVCLSAHNNIKKLIKQNHKYKPHYIISTNNNFDKKNKLIISFDQFLKKTKKIDYVISAVSGSDGLKLNFKLLSISRNLLIANKESIVCGGNFFLKAAKRENCKIVPIDSEHYCINFFLNNFKDTKNIDKIFISASGGPFLKKKFSNSESVKKVINHPTWNMGKEISVGSSNFSNKVLEMFEAKLLFNLDYKKIKIIIESKSCIHSILKLKNNLYFPILHYPTMLLPISNSLGLKNNFKMKLDVLKLNFEFPDTKRFPIIKLGYKILSMKNSTGMIAFTVLNEKLTNLYLQKKIRYGDIMCYLIKSFRCKKMKMLLKTNLKNINNVYKFIKVIKSFEYDKNY